MITSNIRLQQVFVSMNNRIFPSVFFSIFFVLSIPFSILAEPKTPENVFDVITYNIHLKVNPSNKYIEGSNEITVVALKNFSTLNLNLFPQMIVSSVIQNGKLLQFRRDSNLLIVKLPKTAKKEDKITFTVHYSGHPIEAKKAPWDGGFVWSKDSLGHPWVGLACEGIGASCWLPCKDLWSDEPSNVTISIDVPNPLVAVSNGNLISKKPLPNGYNQFVWEVKSPINHYDISINIGNYAHWEDIYVNEENGRLSLNYYVLQGNFDQAKTHFQQVKRMLKTFEGYFGKYPFYEDGYKLVETPFWGMEHQSCIAYGNNYVNNRFGFDFIIVHESGHEWFGNSITAHDKADMWVHEGFTTYSEALFVEKQYGKARSVQYLLGQKGNIKNATAMVGKPFANMKNPDNDIYYKGAWILHTMRSMLDNDTLWFNMLKDLNKQFYHKIVKSAEVERYIISRTKYDFLPFFNQYLRLPSLPVFEYYIVSKNGLNELHYRLNSETKSLKMPIKLTLSKGKFDFIVVEKKWKIYDLPFINSDDFKVDEQNFLLEVRKIPSPTNSDK